MGLQIWRGALLLADWLLYNRETFKEGHYILELGSGVGLSSIVAAMFTPVFCTGKIYPLNKSQTMYINNLQT